MTATLHHVLFLCTGNSARSILAEAILNRLGAGRFQAHSAGSHPKGEVHPMAVELLREHGYATSGLRSKGWEEFAQPGAPQLALVVTVCDAAAGEACPVWPGAPVTAHWSLDDPAACEASTDQQRRAFRRTYHELTRRIERLVQLHLEALDPRELGARLDALGSCEEPA